MKRSNEFINVKLSIDNIDNYFVRHSIFKSIKKSLKYFNGKMLDAGCGKMPYREYILENSKITEYIGLDIETALIYDESVRPDFTWAGINMPFRDNTFNTVFATEVLEHCPDPKIYLNEVHRVLTNGGYFFFTVPFLWPFHEAPHDHYRYTFFSLKSLFKDIGFKEINIYALGGWNASMAVMTGLWLKRGLKNTRKVTIMKKFLFPFIKFLISKDTPPDILKENSMVTGLYGIIKK